MMEDTREKGVGTDQGRGGETGERERKAGRAGERERKVGEQGRGRGRRGDQEKGEQGKEADLEGAAEAELGVAVVLFGEGPALDGRRVQRCHGRVV